MVASRHCLLVVDDEPEVVRSLQDLLRYDAPLEVKDADFGGTPLGWAIHGSENGWHAGTGDYAGTVEVLIAAGVGAVRLAT